MARKRAASLRDTRRLVSQDELSRMRAAGRKAGGPAWAFAVELARLVAETRDQQKEFFASGDRRLLAACRDIERRLDEAAGGVLSPPTKTLMDYIDEQESKSESQ